MATLIKPDGTRSEVSPEKDGTFSLEECYRYIETDIIEHVQLLDGRVMVIDEEGKLKAGWQMRINGAATAIAGNAIFGDDWIVGNALVCTRLEAGYDYDDEPDEDEEEDEEETEEQDIAVMGLSKNNWEGVLRNLFGE